MDIDSFWIKNSLINSKSQNSSNHRHNANKPPTLAEEWPWFPSTNINCTSELMKSPRSPMKRFLKSGRLFYVHAPCEGGESPLHQPVLGCHGCRCDETVAVGGDALHYLG
ncbi:hypothetical protein HNY73_017838 [Argiope bruennichi]|uniref:Uncharacterized protein n=1 Tax=Argiope bruennichi TaxID=94029 RepID=A0A8T0EC52_ARGBR|nr:hypothetical protein HNY73_017838 [Argiope bruennichi]